MTRRFAQSGGVRLVTAFWLVGVLVALVIVAAGPALANVYRCNVKTVQQLSSSGTLGETEWTGQLQRRYGSILWDDVTGLLRGGPAGLPVSFEIIQRGTHQNSTIGIFVNRGPASTYVSVFRLELYDSSLPFMLTDNAIVFAGNCEQLG